MGARSAVCERLGHLNENTNRKVYYLKTIASEHALISQIGACCPCKLNCGIVVWSIAILQWRRTVTPFGALILLPEILTH